jgi:hypothetical protein
MSYKSKKLSPEVILKLNYDSKYTGLTFFQNHNYIYEIINDSNNHFEMIREGLK